MTFLEKIISFPGDSRAAGRDRHPVNNNLQTVDPPKMIQQIKREQNLTYARIGDLVVDQFLLL